MTLLPAYGRDYTSKAQILADFNAGKDFIIADMSHPADGKPANKASLIAEGVRMVNVRYARKTKIAVISVKFNA